MEHIEKCNLSDYSPAVLQYGRAVENELETLIAVEFLDYLIRLPTQKNLSIIPLKLGNMPKLKYSVDDTVNNNKGNFGYWLYLFGGLAQHPLPDFDKFLISKTINKVLFCGVISDNLLNVNKTIDNNKPLVTIRDNRNNAGHPNNPITKTDAAQTQTLVFQFFKQWISAKN